MPLRDKFADLRVLEADDRRAVIAELFDSQFMTGGHQPVADAGSVTHVRGDQYGGDCSLKYSLVEELGTNAGLKTAGRNSAKQVQAAIRLAVDFVDDFRGDVLRGV